MKVEQLGEEALLEHLVGQLSQAGPHVKLSIGDDAAAISLPEGETLLLSTDGLVEDVHFTLRGLPPEFIGRKVVAVNASDMAAMGGNLLAVLVSLVIPVDTEVNFVSRLFEGISERARSLGADVVGGNLSTSPGPLMVQVTATGASRKGRWLTRSGARSGDALYVSGEIGAAAEGLRLLQHGLVLSTNGTIFVPELLRKGPVPLAEECLRAHMDPEPRLELGRFLNERQAATATIDLSDGLSRDLNRLCRASNVGALVEEAYLPVATGVLAWERELGRDPMELVLAGGEDYELLFTVREEATVNSFRRSSDIPLTRIGEIRDQSDGILLKRRDESVVPLVTKGWDHFSK